MSGRRILSQRWTRFTNFRIMATNLLILLSWLSGFGWWSHFAGCGLWNDTYPHTRISHQLLVILRILSGGQVLLQAAISFIWWRRLLKWSSLTDIQQASHLFTILTALELYRIILEVGGLLIFYLFFLEAVAQRPASNQILLTWIVELMVEGVVGWVPLFCWFLPAIFSLVGLGTLSSVWDEFGRQQSFNSLSLYFI